MKHILKTIMLIFILFSLANCSVYAKTFWYYNKIKTAKVVGLL